MKPLNKVKISLLILLFVISILSVKAYAVTGIITEITVNLREKPSTDSKKIMYVTQDDKVEVLEKDGEWYKIKVKGKTGYVSGKYLKVDDDKIKQKEEVPENTIPEETQANNEKIEENKNTNLIIKEKTQIRIIPNISSSIIYKASKDIKINIINQINDWTYISVDSILGWVRTDKIIEENEVLPDEQEKDSEVKKEEKSTKTEKTAYIKHDTVNLREKSSTSAKIIAKLKLNDEVTVIEKVNSVWSKVEIDGKTGYISTELLSDKKQETKKKEEKQNSTTSRDGEETSRENSNTVKEEQKSNSVDDAQVDNTTSSRKTTGADIVAYAKQYLGYKYVSGGTSPKGFDCSGFTYYVYKHFGYTLSRSSKAQVNNGVEVKKSDLQPGDLLIYKNNSLTAIGHVGIYIGDNKMIHASEPGVGVIITDINSKAYKYDKRYVTARRIIK